MNSKEIKVISNKGICMKCLKNKATHTYYIAYRGFGSIYDSRDTKFQCCNECNSLEFGSWFNELPTTKDFFEVYEYEDNISKLIDELPLESQELFYNSFEKNGCQMDAQDWIDYQLEELSHEKCKEYGLYSHEEINSYKNRFPVCKHVVSVICDDGSKYSSCPFHAFGEYDHSIDKCGNISSECYKCKYYSKGYDNTIIKYEEQSDWSTYMIAKLKKEEFEKKFKKQ